MRSTRNTLISYGGRASALLVSDNWRIRFGNTCRHKLIGAQTADYTVSTLNYLNRASTVAMDTSLITLMAALERFVMFDE